MGISVIKLAEKFLSRRQDVPTSLVDLESRLSPKLSEQAQRLIRSQPPQLQELALDSYTTSFHPEEDQGRIVKSLSIDSLKAQVGLLPPDYDLRQGLKNGLGMILDAKNLKLVNDNLGHYRGDQYILTNMETMMEVADTISAHILIGRLTGDEIVAFLLPQDTTKSLASYAVAHGQDQELQISRIIKEAQQSSLSELDQAVSVRQQNLELGIHCKAISIADINHVHEDDKRLVDIISHVISGVERPLPLLSSAGDIVEDLVTAFLAKESLTHTPSQLKDIITKMPQSIKAKLGKIPSSDPLYHKAIELAISATWERLYGETEVMRSAYLFEIAQDLVDKGEEYDLVFFANQDLKAQNKLGHDAGDHCLRETIKLAQDTIDTLTNNEVRPDIHLFQSFGSHIALVPRVHTTKFVTSLNSSSTTHNRQDGSDKLFIVATGMNPLEGSSATHFALTKDNTKDSKTFWLEIDQIVRPIHYLNEQLELLARSIDQNGHLNIEFFHRYSTRTKSRLLDLSKYFPDKDNFIDQYAAYIGIQYPDKASSPLYLDTLKKMLNDLIVIGNKNIRSTVFRSEMLSESIRSRRSPPPQY